MARQHANAKQLDLIHALRVELGLDPAPAPTTRRKASIEISRLLRQLRSLDSRSRA